MPESARIIDSVEQIALVEGNVWKVEEVLRAAILGILPLFCRRFGDGQAVRFHDARGRVTVKLDDLPALVANLLRCQPPRFHPERLSTLGRLYFSAGLFRFTFSHAEDIVFLEKEQHLATLAALTEEPFPQLMAIDNEPNIGVTTVEVSPLSPEAYSAVTLFGTECAEEFGLQPILPHCVEESDLRRIVMWKFDPTKYLLRRDMIVVEYQTMPADLDEDGGKIIAEEIVRSQKLVARRKSPS